MADPDWSGGNYAALGKSPRKGLAVARMAAHITYLSEETLHRKFGRQLQDRAKLTFGFDADFQIESYLRHQGMTFVDRFDANSYLYMTRAMDYFDLAQEHDGVLANAFRGSRTRFCVVSFTSDWLFPTSENRTIVHALNAAAANVSFVEIDTDRGHDSFLLDEPELFATVRGFLSAAAAGAAWHDRNAGPPRRGPPGTLRPSDHHQLCDAGRARAGRRLWRWCAPAAA
jgi:homoserine O-acetyltransferase